MPAGSYCRCYAGVAANYLARLNLLTGLLSLGEDQRKEDARLEDELEDEREELLVARCLDAEKTSVATAMQT